MPVATIIDSVSDKMPLASLPEGYVIVRRMNYGEQLARTGMATRFLVGGDSAKNGGSADAFKGELDIQTAEVALWDFANLIVEHNLTDKQEQPLNFKNPAHVRMLHPRVGEEIGKIIDEWNDAENSDEVKNS